MTNIYDLFMDYQSLLKQIRNTLLVSQAELAKMLNVTFATVNRWGDHRRHHRRRCPLSFSPQKRLIFVLCRFFGVISKRRNALPILCFNYVDSRICAWKIGKTANLTLNM